MVGFDSRDIDATQSMYKCPHCSLLLRDAVQIIDCAHRLCQSCVDDQLGDAITCPECQQKILRERVKPDRGCRNDMQTLPITCSLCEWSGILKNYQNHLDQTHPNPTCAFCNQKFTSVNDLNRHQQFICDKRTMCCHLKSMGCEEMFRRVDAANHYLTDQHQIALVNFIRRNYKTDQNPTMNIPVEQFQATNETIGVLSEGVKVLDSDIERVGSECVHSQNALQPITQELLNIKKSIDEQNAFIDNMKTDQEASESDVLLMKQQLENRKSANYDGTFIWKITDVKEKIALAKTNLPSSIDSPEFYSSVTGYKMCLRLYFNGNDYARGSHMSIYLVLMRGEFDAILRFPFCFDVIFCLFDQSGEGNHIINVFTPDARSNSFQRPQSDMNTACGIPAFVSLTKLQPENTPYIRDDTMFIKVMTDFLGMPQEILLYAISLSPALTVPLQQAIIRQETEKRKQEKAAAAAFATMANGTNQSMDVDLEQNNIPANKSSNKKTRQSDPNSKHVNSKKT